MNAMNMIGRLDSPWQELAAKSSGKKFYKNILRGKSRMETASDPIDKEWAIEMVAFGHTGNSLNVHTGAGDLLGIIGKLQSTERDSQDGDRTFINNSMVVDSYEVLESARKPDSTIPF